MRMEIQFQYMLKALAFLSLYPSVSDKMTSNVVKDLFSPRHETQLSTILHK